MDAKTQFVNIIFCVFSLGFFPKDLFRVQYINTNEKCQIYITIISYVRPLHYLCIKYRVLCLNLMTFDCVGHSFLRKSRGGFLSAWWEIMTLHGWSSSAWQLSFHFERVKPFKIYNFLSSPFAFCQTLESYVSYWLAQIFCIKCQTLIWGINWNDIIMMWVCSVCMHLCVRWRVLVEVDRRRAIKMTYEGHMDESKQLAWH